MPVDALTLFWIKKQQKKLSKRYVVHTYSHTKTKRSLNVKKETRREMSNTKTHTYTFACISITQYYIFYIGLAVPSKCLSSLSVMYTLIQNFCLVGWLSGSLLCHTIRCYAMPLVVFFLSYFSHIISMYVCIFILLSLAFLPLSLIIWYLFISLLACILRVYKCTYVCMYLLPFIYTIKWVYDRRKEQICIPNKEIIFIHIQRTRGLMMKRTMRAYV